ncbi:hypothetical protein FOL47_007184 [Perkinsus chesapeaki]|uniref:Lysophosphatidic acid phosphatase type 6 n=1 Tax=Perkinsus chesapeaki TaxID=330153 RepID=A0A7J6LMZ4_PERCH|nr:hypothetical protein FOL47_007184 [Perkinsus chesapeaki]
MSSRLWCILIGLPLFVSSLYSIADDDDYCFRRPLMPYPRLDNPSMKLVSVQVYLRHGQRDEYTHHECFPNAEQVDYSRECDKVHVDYAIDEVTALSGMKFRKVFVDLNGSNTCETGQLLNGAQDQMRRVADWLREAYVGDAALGGEELELISTDKSRTLGSLYYLLSAFTRPQDQLPKTLDVKVQDSYEDALGLNYVDCPRVKALDQMFSRSEFVATQSNSDSYKRCADLYTELVGPVRFDLSAANDCFLTQYCTNSSYPPGVSVTPKLFNCVTNMRAERRFVEYGFTGFAADPDPSWTVDQALEKCRLRIAPVVRGLLGRAQSTKKLYLIGTHDTTVACLLQSLGGLWDGHWPHYGETVALEAYESTADGQRYFRLLRNHNIIPFPGCPPGEPCPLSVLEGFVKSEPILASEAYRHHRCRDVADLLYDEAPQPVEPPAATLPHLLLWTLVAFMLGGVIDVISAHGIDQFQHRILTAPVDGELVEGVVPPPDVSAFTRHRNKLQHFQHLITKGRAATAEDEAIVELYRDNLRQMLSEVQDRISHSTEHRTPSPTRLLRLARRCTSRDVEQPSEGSILELLPSPVPSKSTPDMRNRFRLRSPPRPAPSMLKRSGSTGNLGLRERDKTIAALQRENAVLRGGCPRCGEASKSLSDCVISMRDVHSRVLKAISDLPSLLKEEESLIAKLSHFRKHRE